MQTLAEQVDLVAPRASRPSGVRSDVPFCLGTIALITARPIQNSNVDNYMRGDSAETISHDLVSRESNRAVRREKRREAAAAALVAGRSRLPPRLLTRQGEPHSPLPLKQSPS